MTDGPADIDAARARLAEIGCGLGVYAFEPGGPVTVEIVSLATGEAFPFTGLTVAAALTAAGFASEMTDDEPDSAAQDPPQESEADSQDPFA